jgi:hypothetical protein
MAINPGFNYKGTLNAKGRLSSRPQKSRDFATLSNIERLVRLDLGATSTGISIPDADLGRMINRSPRYIRVMRQRVEYLKMRSAIQTGIAFDTEESIETIKNYRKAYFKESLPSALRAIVDELERPAVTPFDRKLKIDLAKDFLDREGTFPKISRTDSHVKIEHDYKEADEAASALLAAMDSPVQREDITEETRRVLDANSAFTNSETISNEQQEKALATLEILTPMTDLIN